MKAIDHIREHLTTAILRENDDKDSRKNLSKRDIEQCIITLK